MPLGYGGMSPKCHQDHIFTYSPTYCVNGVHVLFQHSNLISCSLLLFDRSKFILSYFNLRALQCHIIQRGVQLCSALQFIIVQCYIVGSCIVHAITLQNITRQCLTHQCLTFNVITSQFIPFKVMTLQLIALQRTTLQIDHPGTLQTSTHHTSILHISVSTGLLFRHVAIAEYHPIYQTSLYHTSISYTSTFPPSRYRPCCSFCWICHC